MFWDISRFALVMAFLAWVALRGTERLGYHWQWYRVPGYLYTFKGGSFAAGPLLQGLWITLQITAAGMVLCLVFGLGTAILRLSRSFFARNLAWAYVELIRNTPLLIQIFFLYFVLAPILGLGRFASAVLALSLFEGAYASEIFRSGITGIPKAQWEAAYSLGLSRFDTLFRVILPQALRRILPPLTSQAVSLVKDSALVSTIAIYDLTMQGQAIVAETFLTFEIWFTVAAIYLVVTVALSSLAHWLEGRMKVDF